LDFTDNCISLCIGIPLAPWRDILKVEKYYRETSSKQGGQISNSRVLCELSYLAVPRVNTVTGILHLQCHSFIIVLYLLFKEKLHMNWDVGNIQSREKRKKEVRRFLEKIRPSHT
jgi:hypothetical protein